MRQARAPRSLEGREKIGYFRPVTSSQLGRSLTRFHHAITRGYFLEGLFRGGHHQVFEVRHVADVCEGELIGREERALFERH